MAWSYSTVNNKMLYSLFPCHYVSIHRPRGYVNAQSESSICECLIFPAKSPRKTLSVSTPFTVSQVLIHQSVCSELKVCCHRLLSQDTLRPAREVTSCSTFIPSFMNDILTPSCILNIGVAIRLSSIVEKRSAVHSMIYH